MTFVLRWNCVGKGFSDSCVKRAKFLWESACEWLPSLIDMNEIIVFSSYYFHFNLVPRKYKNSSFQLVRKCYPMQNSVEWLLVRFATLDYTSRRKIRTRKPFYTFLLLLFNESLDGYGVSVEKFHFHPEEQGREIAFHTFQCMATMSCTVPCRLLVCVESFRICGSTDYFMGARSGGFLLERVCWPRASPYPRSVVHDVASLRAYVDAVSLGQPLVRSSMTCTLKAVEYCLPLYI